MRKIEDYSLYLVITEQYGQGRSAVEIAEAAIKGGVDLIQMREKNKSRPELVELGKRLSKLCRDNDVIFIVNDDPALAKAVEADGVHLGQEDVKKYSIPAARKILGRDKIIGISTHSLEQFKEAHEKDFDYIAYGPIFKTKTKDYSLGTDDIEHILKIAKKPVVFIGGIDLSNIEQVLDKGAGNIALIRGVIESDDIESKAKEFKNKIRTKKGQ